MSTITQCPECRQELISLGYPCVRMFDDVCLAFFNGRLFVYKYHPSAYENLVLHYLETKGYVMSTDKEDDFIEVVPLNFSEVEEGDFYLCKSVEKHL